MTRFIQMLSLIVAVAFFETQAPVFAQEKDVEEKRVVTPSVPFVRRATPLPRTYLEPDQPQLGEPPQAPDAGFLEFNPMAGRETVIIQESPTMRVLGTALGTTIEGQDNTPPEPPTIQEGEVRDANKGVMFDATIQEFRWSSKRPNQLQIGFRNVANGENTFAYFCNPETGDVSDDPYTSSAFDLMKDDLGAPIRIWLWQYEIGQKRRNPRWRRGSSEPEFMIRPGRYYCIESFFLRASNK